MPLSQDLAQSVGVQRKYIEVIGAHHYGEHSFFSDYREPSLRVLSVQTVNPSKIPLLDIRRGLSVAKSPAFFEMGALTPMKEVSAKWYLLFDSYGGISFYEIRDIASLQQHAKRLLKKLHSTKLETRIKKMQEEFSIETDGGYLTEVQCREMLEKEFLTNLIKDAALKEDHTLSLVHKFSDFSVSIEQTLISLSNKDSSENMQLHVDRLRSDVELLRGTFSRRGFPMDEKDFERLGYRDPRLVAAFKLFRQRVAERLELLPKKYTDPKTSPITSTLYNMSYFIEQISEFVP